LAAGSLLFAAEQSGSEKSQSARKRFNIDKPKNQLSLFFL
jgi:hypothetical protein